MLDITREIYTHAIPEEQHRALESVACTWSEMDPSSAFGANSVEQSQLKIMK
jgi:hypothetical protein